jgi:hypothetical protein
MSTPRKGRGKSGSRKYGRNKVKCALYRVQNRREKNKLRKLKKLSKKQPNNKQIPKLIKKLEG